ncbi:MAG: hypothetical protein IT347_13170 [Candidatus Eisenbacteria bacterium]|nr:hypothetical protein [Candidatus Eisenbacteria bacterium]
MSVLVALVMAVSPVRAGAQGQWPDRVQAALETTDRRIEQAERVVLDSAPAQAKSELATARQQQDRARTAFGAAQYGLAERATLESRSHADRAIAIVRGLPDPERVEVQVERTGELLDRARDRLADCSDPRAKALLRVAQEMQARAEAAIGESRYLAGLQLTTSARERIQKAMRLCNVVESLADNASRALQRTDDLLARLRDRLGDDPDPGVRSAFDRAQSLQAEAHSENRARHFEAALRLTHVARITARRAARSGSSPPGRGRR